MDSADADESAGAVEAALRRPPIASGVEVRREQQPVDLLRVVCELPAVHDVMIAHADDCPTQPVRTFRLHDERYGAAGRTIGEGKSRRCSAPGHGPN